MLVNRFFLPEKWIYLVAKDQENTTFQLDTLGVI